jgi:hypothetical protein
MLLLFLVYKQAHLGFQTHKHWPPSRELAQEVSKHRKMAATWYFLLVAVIVALSAANLAEGATVEYQFDVSFLVRLRSISDLDLDSTCN